jgi:hypothetical protein
MTKMSWLTCLFDKDVDKTAKGRSSFRWEISPKRPLMKEFLTKRCINFNKINIKEEK